ncbi:putative disease resistance protein [Vitis vinifera]|uniref:Putative disease resistance protein n=1 Tax=Vitis vinifera TaxID=29760 RepID=A0A438DF98_VITVI|nr:putative disease resistance protein [Vitis vinifera]
MEFLSSIVGPVPCFYDHASKQTVYIRDLKKNLQALSKEMVDLNNLCEDVKARVERAEQRQMIRTKEVGGGSVKWKTCYKIGKAVSEKLAAVSGQIGKGHFDVVAEMLSRPLVDELPMEETVGSELAYSRICGFLKDPQVGIMGLYGMGEVIWNKLQIPRDIWEIRSSKEEKAVEILRVLKTKKFVLLLDDIWERLDPLEMGVPRPDAQNKSKIVFTTRSQDKEVGEETLSHPHILRLAKTVAEECKGLPLALITLGRALAGERDPSNWDKVIQDLIKFPAEISELRFKRKTVKMHDVIHDMALWLYGECGKEKNKILVDNDVSRLKEAQEIPKMKEVEKMSLWDKNVEEFPQTLVCPNLKTLIMACNKLTKFPSGFFQFMPLIRVLDLSDNDNLTELPIGISELDWRYAALFPCIWYSGESSIMFACLLVRVSDMFCHGGMSSDSQSIDIHGAQTAGKVGVLMMVAASLLFLDCGGSEAASTLLLDQCHVIRECFWVLGLQLVAYVSSTYKCFYHQILCGDGMDCFNSDVSGMFSHGSINADSQSISIHGAQTAGKVTVFMMVVASFYSGPA